jgi:subtilisin family serine protease
LVRVPAGAVGLAAGAPRTIRAAGVTFELEPLFRTEAARVGLTASGDEWHVARPTGALDGADGWALAHAAVSSAAGLAPGGAVFAEPDFVQDWPYLNPSETDPSAGAADVCVFNDQDPALPHVTGEFAWHLDDTFSQLRAARLAAGGAGATRVRIAHLDTGYDPNHSTFPANVNLTLQRNFVDGQAADDAHDPGERGVLKNPGHGCGTLSLLAGRRFAFSSNGYQFDDFVGGAPDAEIVPVRIGNSVVQIRTSQVAQGISYATSLCQRDDTRVHVLSMSMGGLASAAWADAVNLAYEAGIIFVAAAGNNFSVGLFGFPASSIVYPARFRRVIACCGVMADRRPYFNLPAGTMQGNFGPASKMATAISAFTPNTAWAELGCARIVDMEGRGTSASTPQVAASAALYLQRHGATILDAASYPEPWMRVEAVRHALFQSADRLADGGSPEKLGNGIVQSAAAQSVQPAAASVLQRTPADSATFAFLKVLTGVGAAPSSAEAMLALEATQLAQRWQDTKAPNPLEHAVVDPDLAPEAIPPRQTRAFLEGILNHPEASAPLKKRVEDTLATMSGRPPTPAPSRQKPRKEAPVTAAPATLEASPAPMAAFRPPEPDVRCLRGYAIDPTLSTTLDTVQISEMTFNVPWEPLERGPVGEYLEVIDVDPASGAFYEPVDLDDPRILAMDGLDPSEGTPQFHQQMVYAVSSLTIRNFERALGRRTLWRPGRSADGRNPSDDSQFVQRLRVYPHALREPNAYYSPIKIGLLFGYFNAADDSTGDHMPGSLVFTCLSHDVVAHETTHALLDGMHRRFLEATNPDVRAFHEGFADIVALLQHFTFPEILRHQIATTRGDIRSVRNLLGELAGQFGRAIGQRGALRSAIGAYDDDDHWKPYEPDPADYETTTEPHARGAILVAAVFDSFLSIYEHRIADLLRLATGGTGILQPGAVHPDLVGRLATEAAKAAQHVLTMCIRALDYCPPTDITFGEFLRAVMTADADLVKDDDLNYRVAFVEAFRRRGIFPRGVRTLSVENLLWSGPDRDERRSSRKLSDCLEFLRKYSDRNTLAQLPTGTAGPREQTFQLQREARRGLHRWLQEHFASGPDGRLDAEFFGIDRAQPFEVHTVRFADRIGPDGDLDSQILISLLQTVSAPLDPKDPKSPPMEIEGGCSIVADPRRRRIRYCIRKDVKSPTRLVRQQAFAATLRDSLRAVYTGNRPFGADEPFAMLHRGV